MAFSSWGDGDLDPRRSVRSRMRACVHASSLYGKEKCVASEETSTAPVINLSLSDS